MKIFANIFKTGKRKILAGIMSVGYGTVHTAYHKLYSNGGRNGSTKQRLEFAAEKGLSNG